MGISDSTEGNGPTHDNLNPAEHAAIKHLSTEMFDNFHYAVKLLPQAQQIPAITFALGVMDSTRNVHPKAAVLMLTVLLSGMEKAIAAAEALNPAKAA